LRFQRERWKDDHNELRALLDDAAATMYDHLTRLLRVERWAMESTLNLPRTVSDPPDLRPTQKELEMLHARLLIRRGQNDPLVAALRRFAEPTRSTALSIELALDNHEPYDVDEAELGKNEVTYRSAYFDFIDAAKQVAGHDAEPRTPQRLSGLRRRARRTQG
jgi:hypothetical protein